MVMVPGVLMQAVLRWHPDKFKARLLAGSSMAAAEQAQVMARVSAIFLGINDDWVAWNRYVEQLINAEVAAGIPSQRIVVCGFSQGGAIALLMLRSNLKLAGIVGLSTYLPMSKVPGILSDTNKDTPILMCHGDSDQVVAYQFGRESHSVLTKLGADTDFATFSGMGHSEPPRQLPQFPSSQATPQPATPEPEPSTAPSAKRTKAEQAAPTCTQPTKGKGQAKCKAAKAKPALQPGWGVDRDCNAALNMQRTGENKCRSMKLVCLSCQPKEYPDLGCKWLKTVHLMQGKLPVQAGARQATQG
ncbi:hypothetical protein QJQ45_001480 [Haematococcus lacustris]|nr:hypothetical protein QJQ45_001480 [Haematococcus lacustris]